MSTSKLAGIALLLAVAFSLFDGAYLVNETEQVIITQFGKPLGQPVVDPGLRFKVPFIQRVNRFEKRFLEWDGSPNQVPYAVSKGAVLSLIKSLGNAYAKEGVFVNGVEPGRALTDMVVPRFSAEHIADPGNPLGRYSDPEEVAEVAEVLLNERNTYTTGSVWSVKGATG